MEDIKVEISARHVHLTQEAVEVLFGKGHTLTVKKELSQPGQFLAEERVTVVGPKKNFENVGILGPVRAKCQVEFAKSDCFALGIMGAIRESGETEGTPGVEIKSETASINLEDGLIIAKRHIHMTPEQADEFGVKDKDIVNVKVESKDRSLTFGDVVIRVSDKFALAMHIDTDEGNTCNVGNGDGTKAYIVK